MFVLFLNEGRLDTDLMICKFRLCHLKLEEAVKQLENS